MWDFESSGQERQPRKRKTRSTGEFHLRRVPIEIKLGGALGEASTIIPGRLFFNDFSPHELRAYSTHPLDPDTLVSVSILDDIPVFVQCKVRWSKIFHLDINVIRDVQMDYRIAFSYLFSSKEEAENIRMAANDFSKRMIHSSNLEFNQRHRQVMIENAEQESREDPVDAQEVAQTPLPSAA